MLVVPEKYLKLKTNMNVFLNALQLVLFLFNSNLTSSQDFYAMSWFCISTN